MPYVPGPHDRPPTGALPPMGPPTTYQQPISPAPWATGQIPPQAPQPASNNRRLLVAIAALLALIVVGGGVAAVWYLSAGKSPIEAVKDVAGPRTYRITGTLTLADGFSASTTCSGKGGFRDISEGAQVTITDSTGATIALGHLGTGRVDTGGCVFPFEVADVPAGKEFYGIEVSHRGVIKYGENEVRGSSIKLTLG